MAKGKNKNIIIVLVIFIILLILGLTIIINEKGQNDNNKLYALTYNTSDFVYLSDLEYSNSSFASSGYKINLDKNNDSKLISLLVDNQTKTFIKGISAWATSEIIYDLSNLNYDYFTSYLGVDSSQNESYYNTGVIFEIYTSIDNINYNKVYESSVLNGTSNAEFVKIDLKDVKYLKLCALQNGEEEYSNWYDDAVYADAKLENTNLRNNIVASIDFIKTPLEYDEEIIKYRDNIINNDYSNLEEYELLLLQRELVSNIGYDVLEAIINYDSSYEEIFSWLLNDKETLELYLLGGKPSGNYINSIQILNELIKTYSNDLDNLVYKKMMIAISLTHSKDVKLWLNENELSNAKKRYQIFKELYESNKLNKIFSTLSVEELRLIMNNNIDDEEIIWLNDYISLKENSNPFTFITFNKDYDYNKDIYYDVANKNIWDNKYNNIFTKYNVSNNINNPKIWMVFEEGGTNNIINNVGYNIAGVKGIPALIAKNNITNTYLTLNENRDWVINNNKISYADINISERMLNGWGNNAYASSNQGSYLIISEDALKDYDNYRASSILLMLADVFKNDEEITSKIYNHILEIQDINLDAWYNLINLNKQNDEELYSLGTLLVSSLKDYPLPMSDLIKLIENNMTNKEAKLDKLVKDTLNSLLESADNSKKEVAEKILNTGYYDIASFSLDGLNANKIILNSKYQDTILNWEYNITDNDTDWVMVTDKEVLLSQDEISKLNENTDIKIRISNDIYVIDLNREVLPIDLGINDYENKIYNYTNLMEWKYNDGSWTSFSEQLPSLNDDKVINIRVRKHGLYLESNIETYTFTKDNSNIKETYIPVTNLSIESVSSRKELYNENNIIDGNPSTRWETLDTDTEKYITIKLDTERYISALSYIPSTEGIITKVKVLGSLDNINFEPLTEEVIWNNDPFEKKISLENSHLVSYLKIIILDSTSSFASGTMFNLFEDKERTLIPEAKLEYSTNTLTNKDVVVKLVNPNKEIIITNNNGSDTYTFTQNGEFSFEIEDKYGNKNTITAKVDYIDKNLPTGILKFSTLNDTNKNVVVTLVSDEDIIILNNNGSNVYTFTKNGTFEFLFQDLAGNQNSIIAKVTWINNKTNNKPTIPNTDNNNDDDDENLEEEKPIIPDINNNDDNNKDNEVEDKPKNDIDWYWILFLILFCSIIFGIIIVILINKNKKDNIYDIFNDDDKLFKENKDVKAKKDTEVFEENTKELFNKEEKIDVLEKKKTASLKAKSDNLLNKNTDLKKKKTSNSKKKNTKKNGNSKNKKAS